jgi:methylase of polypeptide subunit release factors
MEIPNDPALTFRILDPSCGCGAFLIASANRLFKANQHQNFSLQQRLDLLSCIRGIDIDSQAIIWARRVLLLTAWQDAIEMNAHGADNSVNIPDLSKTIVAADFLFTPLEPVDALIGGPPFVRLQQLRIGDPEKFARYQAEFQTARSGQFDLYMLFFEKAINMLAEGGRLGWSVSNTFLRSQSGRAVRQQISSKCDVRELVEFEARKIYPDAVTQIALVLLERTEQRTTGRHVWIRGNHGPLAKLQLLLHSERPSDASIQICEIPAAACSGPAWSLHSHQESDAGQTIIVHGKPLGELPIQICSGIVTGADEVFLVRPLRIWADGVTIIRNRARSEHLIESALLRPIIRNRDLHAFKRPMPHTLCIVPYDEGGKLMDEIVFQDRFPRAYRYLKLHHRQLADRPASSELPWYSFRSSAALQLPPGPRILLKRISSRPDYALDPDGSQLCHGTVIILALTSLSIDPLVTLGIFNSPTFWDFVRSAMPTIADGHAIQIKKLRDFPLPCLPNTTAECDVDAIRASVRKLLDNTIKSSCCAMTRKELDAAVNRTYHAGKDK